MWKAIAGGAVGATLLLASCTSERQAAAVTAHTASDSRATRPESQDDPSTTAAPGASHQRIEDAAPTHATQPPGIASGVLPLTPGVYVLADAGCSSPPNAGVRFYDGRGISGSATHACRATVRSSDGNVYQVEQSCIDTPAGPGPRTSAPQTITVHDAISFTLSAGNQSARFLYCDAGRLPDHLRQRMEQANE